MKSKQDIHLAIAALTMMTFKARTQNDARLARKAASVLCWVMNYPTDFDKFMDKVKELDLFNSISPERLDEIIQESIVEVQKGEGEGFNE